MCTDQHYYARRKELGNKERGRSKEKGIRIYNRSLVNINE
jgi:hypothetical protein